MYFRIQLIIHDLSNQDLLSHLHERLEQRQLVVQQLIHLLCCFFRLLILVFVVFIDLRKYVTESLYSTIKDLYKDFYGAISLHLWILAHESGIKHLRSVELFENEDLHDQILEEGSVFQSFHDKLRREETLILQSKDLADAFHKLWPLCCIRIVVRVDFQEYRDSAVDFVHSNLVTINSLGCRIDAKMAIEQVVVAST